MLRLGRSIAKGASQDMIWWLNSSFWSSIDSTTNQHIMLSRSDLLIMINGHRCMHKDNWQRLPIVTTESLSTTHSRIVKKNKFFTLLQRFTENPLHFIAPFSLPPCCTGHDIKTRRKPIFIKDHKCDSHITYSDPLLNNNCCYHKKIREF